MIYYPSVKSAFFNNIGSKCVPHLQDVAHVCFKKETYCRLKIKVFQFGEMYKTIFYLFELTF